MPTTLEEQLIKQKLAVNAAMSGNKKLPDVPVTPQKPSPPAMFQLNPNVPDPEGLMTAMRKAGLKGQRTKDIELPLSLEELLARAAALSGQR